MPLLGCGPLTVIDLPQVGVHAVPTDFLASVATEDVISRSAFAASDVAAKSCVGIPTNMIMPERLGLRGSAALCAKSKRAQSGEIATRRCQFARAKLRVRTDPTVETASPR